VPVNVRQLRNPRQHSLYVSLAGPATNIALSLLAIVLFRATLPDGPSTFVSALPLLTQFFFFLGMLNVFLAVFNLLPIPPLDGSHVFKYLLPRPIAVRYEQFGRYGLLALIILLQWGGGALSVWMSPVDWAVNTGYGLVDSWVLPTTAKWGR